MVECCLLFPGLSTGVRIPWKLWEQNGTRSALMSWTLRCRANSTSPSCLVFVFLKSCLGAGPDWGFEENQASKFQNKITRPAKSAFMNIYVELRIQSKCWVQSAAHFNQEKKPQTSLLFPDIPWKDSQLSVFKHSCQNKNIHNKFQSQNATSSLRLSV